MTTGILRLCGWQVVPLGRLLESAQSGFASGKRDPDGVIQMRMNNVTTDGNLDWTSFIRVPTSQEQLRKYRLIQGDVLFNSTNSPELVGKTAVFDGHSEPVVFSNHFVRLRVDETKVDPRYLARWLTKQWQQRVFENLCTQWVNQAAVRKDDLLSLKVPLPPLPEQQRIAAILGRADRLRRLRRTARELGDTYLQSVFLEMFGDGGRFCTKTLGELLQHSPKNGLYLPADKYGSGTPIIRINNFYDGILGDPGQFKRVQASPQEVEEFSVANGEILVNRVNSLEYLGKCALVQGLSETTLFESNMMRLRVDTETVLPLYLVNFLTSRQAYSQILQRARKAVNQASINQQDVKSLLIPVPPLSLQQDFAHIVRKFERLRAQRREAERQAEHLFQALLHRAFRGEV